MNATQKLIDRIARLNPDAGEIGAGMLASLVADARAIQSEAVPSTGERDYRTGWNDALELAISTLSDCSPDTPNCVWTAAYEMVAKDHISELKKLKADCAALAAPAPSPEPLFTAMRTVAGDGLPLGVKLLYAAPIKLDEPQKMKITDEMVTRFLMWRLPDNFNPDCGISFKRTYNECSPFGTSTHEPTGTNLLSADQARAMLEHVLAAPSPIAPSEPMPCPFCGKPCKLSDRASNETVTGRVWFAACYCGGYSSCAHKMADTREGVIALWNLRVALPSPVAPSEQSVTTIEAAIDAIEAVINQRREPGWSYRNTITTNREIIRAECRKLRAALPEVKADK